MNKITSKNIGLIIILSNVFNAMAIDIYLPSLPAIQKHFNVSEYKTQLIIVVFYFGAVVSRLFWGPFSDIVGRKKAILSAYIIQAFFQFLCLYSPNIECVIICRVLQSLGSGVTSVIGAAIVADYYEGNTRAQILNYIELSFVVAFIFAPVIGIILNNFFGWQGGFVFILFSFILSIILFYCFLPPDQTAKNYDNNTINKILKIYKDTFNFKIFEFSLVSGIGTALFMNFSVKAPFVYISRFSVSDYEYIFLQMSPLLINLIIMFNYKKIIDSISINKTISYSIGGLIFLSLTSICIANKIIELDKYTYLFTTCFIAVIMPFLTTGGITMALENAKSQGTAASISSSVRSICIFIMMYMGSVIELHHMFYLIPIITVFLAFLWFSKTIPADN